MAMLSKSILLAGAICAFAAEASAYTMNGKIPAGGKAIIVKLHRPIKPGFMQFTVAAPTHNAGVPYALNYCIGPAANPCGSVGSRVVSVPDGETRDMIVPSSIFDDQVLVVSQGTSKRVPYLVRVNYVP